MDLPTSIRPHTYKHTLHTQTKTFPATHAGLAGPLMAFQVDKKGFISLSLFDGVSSLSPSYLDGDVELGGLLGGS